MFPAHQGFDAADLSRCQRQLRLVQHRDVAICDGPVQIGFKVGQPSQRIAVRIVLEHLDLAGLAAARQNQRRTRPADQRGGRVLGDFRNATIVMHVAGRGDPYSRRKMDDMVIDDKGGFKGTNQCLGQPHRLVDIDRTGDCDGKFRRRQPRQQSCVIKRVSRHPSVDDLAEPQCDGTEHAIGHGAAISGVDLGKAPDADDEHEDRPRNRRILDSGGNPRLQLVAGGKTGQQVMALARARRRAALGLVGQQDRCIRQPPGVPRRQPQRIAKRSTAERADQHTGGACIMGSPGCGSIGSRQQHEHRAVPRLHRRAERPRRRHALRQRTARIDDDDSRRLRLEPLRRLFRTSFDARHHVDLGNRRRDFIGITR